VLYAASRGGPDDVPPSAEIITKITDSSGTPQERGRRLLSTLFPAHWLKDHPDPRAYFPTPREHATAESMKKQEKAMSTPMETDGRLQTIACPVLLLTGDEDVLTPPQNSELLAKVIPGATLVKMEGGTGCS
jgi:pimeloyl-ACP methyl ester carboxylesterase